MTSDRNCKRGKSKLGKKLEEVPQRPVGRPVRTLRTGWLSAKDLAKAFSRSTRWVREHLGSLALKVSRRDSQWWEPKVDAWLAEHGQPPYRELVSAPPPDTEPPSVSA